jgi:hypothetical protein
VAALEADNDIKQVPSSAVLRECLIAGNRMFGVSVTHSDAIIERSVIRDTRTAPDVAGGVGLTVGGSAVTMPGHTSRAAVRDCLVASNRFNAIQLVGGEVTVERTVVRDTRLPGTATKYGTGIMAGYLELEKQPSTLTITDTVVASSRTVGISLWGSSAKIERSVVRGILPSPDGFHGTGINLAGHRGRRAVRSKLVLRESLVAESSDVGIAVLEGSSATVTRSEVRRTSGLADGTIGDGLAARHEGSSLVLSESLVSDSLRAGLLIYEGGRGEARRSVFRRGAVPIYLYSGVSFSVSDDNVFVDNVNDGLGRGTDLTPAREPEQPKSFFK